MSIRSFHSIIVIAAGGVRLAMLALSAMFALGIAGCGNKGPLYLPDGSTPPAQEQSTQKESTREQ